MARRANETPHPESVAHYLVNAVPTARPEESAAVVRERLTGGRYDDASHVFVVAADGRLVGVGADRRRHRRCRVNAGRGS